MDALASPEAAKSVDRLLAIEDRAADARIAVLRAIHALRVRSTRDALGAIDRVARAIRAGRSAKTSALDPVVDAEIAVLAAIDGELADARVEAGATLDREATRISEALRAIARDPSFREAVAWQNRAALANVLDSLLARPATARDADTRRKELVVARYAQRYCTKNDTIGYFGPSVFGAFADSAAAIAASPGPALLRRRDVYLEYWAVDALAAKLTALPGIRPWLVPRRLPLSRLEGDALVSPFGREPLSPALRATLERCDGERSCKAIASDAMADPALGFAREHDVYAAIDALEQRGAVRVALEIPPSLPPFTSTLRGMLERIGDPEVRRAALAPLTRLDAARADLAAAAGDAAAVDRTLDRLETVFTELTGESPTRSAGEVFAGRTVAYEDCQRDVDVVCGAPLLDELAAPLSLLLTSCRWLTYALRRHYGERLVAIFDEQCRDARADHVDFFVFWMLAGGLFKTDDTADNPGARAIVADLQARWARLLAIPEGARRVARSAADLARAAADLFDAPAAGWPTARYHSPDLMIAAASADAIRRGDYLIVVGEVHAGYNTLENAMAFQQHPAPEDLLRAIDLDLPDGRVAAVPTRSFGMRMATLSMSPNPKNVAHEVAGTRSGRPRSQTITMADVVVRKVNGELRMATRDGARSFGFAEFLDAAMGEKHLSFLATAAHTPRVTIDRMVLARETWRFDTRDVPFAEHASTSARFAGARRWAKERELPRAVFVKATSEPKPVYVDFDSPIGVDELARLARQSTAVTLSEVLPGAEECWLADAQGGRYTSELRIVAVDPKPWPSTAR